MTLPPIAEVLPHRPPMVLLDAITACDDDGATCEVVVRDGALFVEDRAVPGAVFLEYMAQTIGAFAGCKGRSQGREVQVGYLIGARELNLHVPHASVGDRLVVTARMIWGSAEIGNFRCELRRDGALLADGVLSVYQGSLPEDAR